MCVCCIGHHDSILLGRKLGWIVVLAELDDLLLLHLHVLLTLAHRHLHTTILNDVVWTEILLLFLPLFFLNRSENLVVLFFGCWLLSAFTFFRRKILLERVKCILEDGRFVLYQLVHILYANVLLVLLSK